jgi:hypothetical protein
MVSFPRTTCFSKACDEQYKLILQGFSSYQVQIAQWFTETEKHLYPLLWGVCRAPDTHGATIQHMRIDHPWDPDEGDLLAP